MHPGNLRIEDYTYSLPDERIAMFPLGERDASKLLVYEGGNIAEDIYRNIDAYLPANTLMVFNQTRVVHARLQFQKPTGGAVEIFCLEPAMAQDMQTAMLQTRTTTWKCLVGGAKKWKAGTLLSLVCEEGGFTLEAGMVQKHEGFYTIQLTWSRPELTFAEVLHFAGKVPLPPYISREANAVDSTSYQTIYATNEGSVAAPTAGLHFTETILNKLEAKGVTTEFVTLHVGAGTFKPVKSPTMYEHDMHAEWIDVDIKAIETLMHHDGPVVAVGTTSLRTIESLYWIGAKISEGMPLNLGEIAVEQWDPYEPGSTLSAKAALGALHNYLQEKKQSRIITRTRVLIAPGYTFRIASGLATNFHQPQSTLLLLVSALIGDDWRKVYNYALSNGFRFLSYGDGSLLWQKK